MSPMSAPERSRRSVSAGPSTLIASPTIRKLTRYSRTERGTSAASVISPVGNAGAGRAASAGGRPSRAVAAPDATPALANTDSRRTVSA